MFNLIPFRGYDGSLKKSILKSAAEIHVWLGIGLFGLGMQSPRQTDKKQEKTDVFHGISLSIYGVQSQHLKNFFRLLQNTAQKISRVHTH